MSAPTLSSDLLPRINAYWRAANYLSVGQIFVPVTVLGKGCHPCQSTPAKLAFLVQSPGWYAET